MALDFPSNPINGQTYGNYYYDSAKGIWRSLYRPTVPSVLDSPTINNAVITSVSPNATTVPVTVKGAASQSANLQEWKNSSNVVSSRITSYGSLHTPTLGVGLLNPPDTGGEVVLQTYGRQRINSDGTNSAGIWFTGVGGSDVAFIGSSSTTGTDPIGIYHNGAWRLQVDSSGRVRTPYQPAFRAYYPSASAGAATISFSGNDSAFSGRNSGWNGSNRFTAPIAGVYVFSFAILILPSIARINFRINGSASTTYGETLIDGYNSYASPSMSMAFKLNANDYVELYNEQAAVYGTNYGSFSGYFLG